MAELLMSDLETFRTEARAWLEANCPKEVRKMSATEYGIVAGGSKQVWKPGQKEWVDAMAGKGWTVPMWPKEYGGAGLTKAENKVLR